MGERATNFAGPSCRQIATRGADDLLPRPTCQGVKVHGVKVSRLISIAWLWRHRARLSSCESSQSLFWCCLAFVAPTIRYRLNQRAAPSVAINYGPSATPGSIYGRARVRACARYGVLVSVRKHFESFESFVIQSGDLIREGHHRCGRRRTADVTTAANCDIRVT